MMTAFGYHQVNSGHSPGDFPHPRGKRHPFVAVLALAWSAMLCGYRSDTAIAEWGRHYGHQWVRALAFPAARSVLRHCTRL